MSDANYKYINGLINYGDLQFKCLYDKTEYASIDAITGPQYWGVSFPDGTGFTFKGTPHPAVDAVTVNAPITYTISIALESSIDYLN